jgi:TPR repeat protein
MRTKDSAKRENPDVQFQLGMRASAKGGATGLREAIRWYRKAASGGHIDALVNLACHFRDGRGVRRNPAMAQNYFQIAAKQGSREAMTCLGRLLLERAWSRSTRELGRAWLRKAAQKGDWSAPHFLGRAAEEDGNWREAAMWYQRALERGDLTSGLRLARHYLDHLNSRNHKKGVAVLRRAIKCSTIDPAWAYTELAKCYLGGLGVAPSKKRARYYFELAAHRDREAQTLLRALSR